MRREGFRDPLMMAAPLAFIEARVRYADVSGSRAEEEELWKVP
jgi:hypothetical protein